MKKIFNVLFVLATLVILTVVASFNISAETVGGACGDTYNDATGKFDNAIWSFDTESGVLTISGKGKMGHWSWDNMPWYPYRNQIKSVVIEEGITHISENSFQYHTAMTEIFIPSSITSIGGVYSVFSDCDALTAVHITDVAAWCKIDFHFGSGNNPLPFAKALYLNGNLVTELTIPDSVTEIPRYAFNSCNMITKVNLPKGLISIGESAFAGCTSLSELQMPESVRFVGNRAFFHCSALIEKDSGISYVGNWMIECSNDITELMLRDGTVGIAERSIGTNVKKLYIPSSLKVINKDAISISGYMNEVHITDMAAWCGIDFGMGLLSPNCGLYLNGTLVTDLNIPDGVTTINPWAFGNYLKLISIVFPDSVQSIGNNAFISCNSLKNVRFSTSIASIGDHAFENCVSLESVLLPEGVVSIGKEAFSSCYALKTVSFPRSIAFIGYSAFNFCSNIESVYFPDIASWCNVQIESKNSLPSANNQILYWNGARLSELHIPDGVTSIGNYAFVCCFDITTVTLPDSVISIGDCAFFYCENLKSVQLSNHLTSIGNNAFYNCFNLTNLTIPKSVMSIGAGAFRGCSALTTIEIPKGITAIENDTFAFCKGLTTVHIPNGITNIGRNAFYNCENLITVSIPNSVTSIGESAFSNCKKLKTIVFCGTNQQWNTIKKGDYWIAYAERADFIYHDWNDGQIAEAHTQTAVGKRLYICTVCGESKTETIGHSYGNWEQWNDTAHKRTCACGDIQQTKHIYDNSKDTSCNDCGYARKAEPSSGTAETTAKDTTEFSPPEATAPETSTSKVQPEESLSEDYEKEPTGCNTSIPLGTGLILLSGLCIAYCLMKKIKKIT
ncbi:MAG: leucine-rich repeat domain-containing protein [Clostridia bacterium]|nr:leucine-rich repeat domain-containing protein [Clostridia bacterium]